MAAADLVLHVPDDDDVLRSERMLRSLRTELAELEGVRVELAAPSLPSDRGSEGRPAKGGALSDPALWIFLGTATHASSRVLIEAIRAWSARSRNRMVRVTSGDETVEISGDLDDRQERLVEKFTRNDRS